MRKRILLLLLAAHSFALLSAQASSLAANAAQRVVYKTYTNARYGYTISYPANLLTPQREADNGDGRAFTSADGAAVMRVYGSQDLGGGLAGAYREAQAGKTVTYKTMKGDWFVVSGRDGDKIFYQKTLYKDGVFKTFLIEYDAARKSTYDGVTARVARSFVG